MMRAFRTDLVQGNHEKKAPEFFAVWGRVNATLRTAKETAKDRLNDVFHIDASLQFRPRLRPCERQQPLGIPTVQFACRPFTTILNASQQRSIGNWGLSGIRHPSTRWVLLRIVANLLIIPTEVVHHT